MKRGPVAKFLRPPPGFASGYSWPVHSEPSLAAASADGTACLWPSSPSLIESGLQDRNDGAVLGRVQLLLDRNLRLQVEYPDTCVAEDAAACVRQERTEIPVLADDAKYIEGPVTRHQQMMPRPTECFCRRPEIGTLAVVRPQRAECFFESIDIASVAVGNNIQVKRGDGRAFDDGCHTADEHKANAMATQGCKDGGEVSRLAWHGEAQRPS